MKIHPLTTLLAATILLTLLGPAHCAAKRKPRKEHKIHFGLRTQIVVSDISLTKIKDDHYHLDESTSSKGGFCGGIFVEVPLFKYASVQGEALSTDAGFIQDYHDFGQQHQIFDLHYLSFPLLVKARIIGFALYGGVQYSVLQSARNNGQSAVGQRDLDDDHEHIEWALVYGIEYTAPFGLGFNVRYNYGLSNIAVHGSHTYPIPNDITNRIVQFGLYYRFLR